MTWDAEHVTRRTVMHGDGECVIAAPAPHHHPNVAQCFEHGHELVRLDAWGTYETRFQHGDNPEHAMTINLLEVGTQRCLGFEVDDWLSRVHAQPVLDGEEANA